LKSKVGGTAKVEAELRTSKKGKTTEREQEGIVVIKKSEKQEGERVILEQEHQKER
jgi:hypothetical protein